MSEMSEFTVKDATLITAREHLEEVVVEFARCPRLAIDTESNGFYAYQEKVCLFQISTPTEDFIVDPLAVKDFSSLGPLMADPAIEKIFHAGEYDVLCLKRDYGFQFANLFDTMIASRILGFKELGLAAAIERHFGVKLSKKLQRADWGKRPMSLAQTRYAQMDTHYLMRLADIQKELLRQKEREEDAKECFEGLADLQPVTKTFDPDAFWKMTGRNDFSGLQASCLKEIFLFREKQSQSRDKAPFRVMAEDLMVRLALAMPSSVETLSQVKGMSPYLLERFGAALLACVERGKAAGPLVAPPRTRPERRDNCEWKLFESLRQWRKAQAERESLDPVVILSSETLRAIARDATTNGESDPLKSLSALKRGRYGEQLLALLKSH